jgi:hypothetical protein
MPKQERPQTHEDRKVQKLVERIQKKQLPQTPGKPPQKG